MPDELSGFEPEPTFNLAALAGQEQLQERIRDLENERAQMAADLRLMLSAKAVTLPGPDDFAEAWNRLSALAWPPADGSAAIAACDGSTTGSEGRTDGLSAAEPTWTATRSQLIDALANIEVRGVQTSGPMAGKVIADDMADAILEQLPGGAP